MACEKLEISAQKAQSQSTKNILVQGLNLEKHDDVKLPHAEKPKDLYAHADKSSCSNSSMNMSSDSSSSLKLEEGKDEQAGDSVHSEDSDESDLLKIETDSKYLKKLNRPKTMQRSTTEVLPKLTQVEGDGSFNSKIVDFNKLDDLHIPLKKSSSGIHSSLGLKKATGLDKLVKEFEDNDKLREDMNRRFIIKKFNEIKGKSYNSNYYQNEESDKLASHNSEKKKYVMHVTESELKIIRKNRNLLLDLGAMLFWDHKYDNIRSDHAFFHHADNLNEKKIEFQISGNFAEVEKAKEAVIFLLNYERKIEKEQVVVIEIDMWIPKVLIRKVVGYHEKNLIDYFKKFDVSISYDSNLINNEFYPVFDQTMITIKGKKAFAEIVASDVNEMVTKLIIRTIHLAPAD